jgi:hypothetical protein
MEVRLQYPLTWPADRPRTPIHARRQGGNEVKSKKPSLALAIIELRAEIQDIKPPVTVKRISTNMPLLADGLPATVTSIGDPGVDLLFEIGGVTYRMSCDRFFDPAHNLRNIARHLRDFRLMSARGVADLRTLLSGFRKGVDQ